MTAVGRPVPPESGGPLVEARDVHLSFGPTPAFRGASRSARAGKIVAVMGPSGSCKSTLLRCLAGILVPDSGEVRFDGRLQLDIPSLHRDVPIGGSPNRCLDHRTFDIGVARELNGDIDTSTPKSDPHDGPPS